MRITALNILFQQKGSILYLVAICFFLVVFCISNRKTLSDHKTTWILLATLICIETTLFVFPYPFLAKWGSADAMQPRITSPDYGYLFLVVAAVALWTTIGILVLIHQSKKMAQPRNVKENIIYWFILSVYAIFMILRIYCLLFEIGDNMGNAFSVYRTFYRFRSMPKMPETQRYRELTYLLCNLIPMESNNRMTPEAQDLFLHQYNTVYAQKLTAKTYNHKFGKKKCPIGMEGDVFPDMKATTV